MPTLRSWVRPMIAPAALVVLVSGCASGGAIGSSDIEPTQSREPTDPAVVTAEQIEQSPRAPLIQGRVAGVQIIQVSGGIQVRIRGRSTIQGDTEPLYIVDGVAVRPYGDGTIPVVANDIEYIRILKDAVDTTFYGVRGANGVIVIRTKGLSPERPRRGSGDSGQSGPESPAR